MTGSTTVRKPWLTQGVGEGAMVKVWRGEKEAGGEVG